MGDRQTEVHSGSKVRLLPWERPKINAAIRRKFYKPALRYREAHSRLSEIAYLPKNRKKVPKRILGKLRRVASHSGTHLIIKGAVKVPRKLAKLWENPFDNLRKNGSPDKKVSDALNKICHHVLYLVGASGHLPLMETWQPKSISGGRTSPKYIVHVQGLEFSGRHSLLSHKLPIDLSTLSPHRPIGNSLFDDGGLELGELCPDLVVFICLRSVWYKKNLGGQALDLDCIREEIAQREGVPEEESQILKSLSESAYKLKGETLVGHQHFSFMSNSRMNVLGKRDNLNTYMRYDDRRVDPIEEGGKHRAALNELQQALKSLEQSHRSVNIRRGDIWIVNNRRVATKWPIQCERPWYAPLSDKTIKHGNRTILRMSFYSPSGVEP